MDDLTSALGLVTRSVETVDVDGRPSRRSVLTRVFPTDAADLWDAVTNPERVPRWFLPLTGDLRLGGRYQLEGNAGGEVLTCEPPHLLRLTWEFGGGEPTWVRVSLTEHPDGTRLELEHSGHVPEEMWEQFGPSATGLGWDLALLGLGLHVDSGEALDMAEVGEWMQSPHGLAFLEGSAASWRDADVADGTDPEAAVARTARTIAVYTGQAEPPQP